MASASSGPTLGLGFRSCLLARIEFRLLQGSDLGFRPALRRLRFNAPCRGIGFAPHLLPVRLDLTTQPDQLLLGFLKLLLCPFEIGIGLSLGCGIDVGLTPGLFLEPPFLGRRSVGGAAFSQKTFEIFGLQVLERHGLQ